jgi:hypothetical protein
MSYKPRLVTTQTPHSHDQGGISYTELTPQSTWTINEKSSKTIQSQ